MTVIIIIIIITVTHEEGQAGGSYKLVPVLKKLKHEHRITQLSERCGGVQKDTNNPPDVDIAGHSVAVVWKTIDALHYHHRQLFVTGHFHCLCNHIQ